MTGSAPPTLEQWLHGAGAVGADLLAVDWYRHPLGPPEQWPGSLANAVRIVLGSRFSMWMAWGPQLWFFCNDAYRRDTLGSKYPWALGRRADDVWAEIWPDIGPRIDRVLAGGSTWDEALLLFLERDGYVEETYHTFSYSPLTDDDGRTAGMLCVVSEDTERVLGERRMRTLRDLGTNGVVVRSEEDVFAAAAPPLEANPRCLPFTLTYLFEDDGSARLGAATGVAPGAAVAPAVLAADDARWPVRAAARGEESVVVDLLARFGDVPVGAWPEPPHTAAVMPLVTGAGVTPSGFVVVGLNRYRPFDEPYQGFLRLLAGHLAAGVATARAYRAERERAEALALLDRAKTEFFTNVSHEFRTPLTLLLGPAEDALADTAAPLPGRQRDRVELVHRNARRMLRLVNMLLDFSRLEAGRTTAALEPVDVHAWTADLTDLFRPAFERAGLALVVGPAGGGTTAHVDRDLWADIVLNLLSNALKHTFTGGVTVRVEGRDGPGDGSVRLEVADTGVGIPDGEQDRLFARFHRVHGAASRSHEGTGIGLALVAELAALHGGTVAVASTPGRGSTFTVEVPRGTGHLRPELLAGPADPSAGADAAGRRAVAAAEGFLAEALRWDAGDLDDPHPPGTGRPGRPAPSADPPPGHERPARLLVVDDNADMREYLVSLLAPTYDVEVAVDGQEALERARARRPDLVLTDVMMPRLDGFGLLAALREDPATVGVPVVLVSARAGGDAAVEGLEAGADDYLVKPFGARELHARVRANLELDRTRRTAAALERSRALLDHVQKLASVGSWEADLRTDALRVSDEAARQAGRAVADLQRAGFRQALAAVVHPDDLPGVTAALAAALDSGPALDVEVRYVRPDGTVRPHRLLGEVDRDDAGVPVRLRGSTQDVTDQVRARELRAGAAAAAEAAAREHAIAEDLQRSLLPEQVFAPDALRVSTYYRAGVEGTHIGGDWFDVVELGAGRAALVIGDVMGRGVPAAAVMAQLRASVRAFARLDLPPADLLELLDGVVRDLGEDQIVTCVYAVYDPGTRGLTFANAGHLPPLLVGADGAAQRLTAAAGPPLGTGPFTLAEETALLPAGCTLALYTDGLVERRDNDLDEGIDALAAALTGAGSAAGAARTPDALVARLLPDGPDDDVAVLLAEVVPDPLAGSAHAWPVADDPREVARTRRLVRAALDAWELPAAVQDTVVLAVSELVTNAILHARPPAELRLRRGRGHVVVEVHDTAQFLPRKRRPAADDEHGRGLQLVSHVAERWGTRPTPGGKAVWCLVPAP